MSLKTQCEPARKLPLGLPKVDFLLKQEHFTWQARGVVATQAECRLSAAVRG